MKRPTESQICMAIASRLEIAKPACFWTHIANEMPMSGSDRVQAKIVGAKLKRMGKRRGVPDYMFVGLRLGPPVFFYEVKREGGCPTKDQVWFISYCHMVGIPCEWRGSDDWEHHYEVIEGMLKLGGAM